jgi:predicted ArsR family transcriptional regulator
MPERRSMAVALQVQARALGDPTRHQIFRYIADAGAPVDVAELTTLLGLNHNAIRQHLAKLVDAELITEGRASSGGRGRPKLVYSLHPAAESRWGVTGPYERLSMLLTEMIRTGDSAEEVGRRSVRPRSLGSVDGDTDPIDVLVDAMERQGFEPEVRRRGQGVDVTLQTCPFEASALVDPETVCSLHLGIAQGAADLTNGRLVIDELVPHDPRRARCRLRVHVDVVGDDDD